MIKHTKTIRRQQPTNYLSVFDHFVGLALKGLTWATDEDFHNGKSLKNGKAPTLNRWRLHYRNWNLFVRYLQQLNKGISSNNRFENFWKDKESHTCLKLCLNFMIFCPAWGTKGWCFTYILEFPQRQNDRQLSYTY